jgi:hypothetical protein
MRPARLLIPLALFGGALALRAIGLSYGLPDVYNPDEVAIMARALSFARGTLNPHNFLYPTFYFYVLFAVVGAYLAFLRLSGQVTSIAALQALYFTQPTGIYLAGRLLSAVTGAASVLVLRDLSARLFDRRIGTTAAIFLAVAPLHVRDSHYVKHDVFATLLVVLAYVTMARLFVRAPGAVRRGDVPLAAVACGAAFSTHYYCIFLALPLTWSVIHAHRGAPLARVARQIGAAALISAVTFFALSPFLLLEPGRAIQDIVANREIVIDRAVAEGAFAPALRYLEMLWSDSISRVIVLLAAAGSAWLLIADWRRGLLLLSFPLPFFLFITNTFPASRYLNPILPFIALFAAFALVRLVERVTRSGAVLWALVGLIVIPPAAASLRTVLFIREADTRTLARTWIEANIPPNTTVLVQPYSVMLTPSREGLVEALEANVGDARAASTKFQIQLGLDPYPSPAYRVLYLGRGGLDADKLYVDPDEVNAPGGLEQLRSRRVAFVLLKRYNSVDSELTSFLAALARDARRVAVFSPFRPGVDPGRQARIDPFLHNTDARIDEALERPGPLVEIWQLNGSGS